MVYQLGNIPGGRRQGETLDGVAADESREQAPDVRRDWTDSTLADRLRYLAEREGVSISRLGEQAGLTRAAIHRMAKDESREVKRFAGTIDKLATRWNVSSEWLFYGRGDPDRPTTVEQKADQFPHRAEACAIALDGGIEPEAVLEVRELSAEAVRALLAQHPGQPQDASILWWLHQIESRALALRSTAKSQR
jgi:transcriptional regulator with XRE-family HTH domain